jgi:hypothetical protein
LLSLAFPALANVPILGGIPIFEFSLLVILILGAIYWYGFKRRSVDVPVEVAASVSAD